MKLLSGKAAGHRRLPVLVVIAGILLYAFWPEDPLPVQSGASPGVAAGARAPASPHVALEFARRLVSSMSTNLFATHSWYVPPPPAPTVVSVPAAPTAPPLPYSFLGSYARGGDRTVYFLVKGDSVFDVHVGDTLENTYSVDGVTNGQLQFTYLPLKMRQSLSVWEIQ